MLPQWRKWTLDHVNPTMSKPLDRWQHNILISFLAPGVDTTVASVYMLAMISLVYWGLTPQQQPG